MFDLLSISICPDIINRRKFIRKYFEMRNDGLYEEWVKQLIQVSSFTIPVLYYYSFAILS